MKAEKEIKSQIIYRKMVPDDTNEVRLLHDEWFPIKYNDEFYTSMAQGTEFGGAGPVFCIVAVHEELSPTNTEEEEETGQETRKNKKIVGLISAQVQALSTFGRDLPLPSNKGCWDGALYILTIGTHKEFRKMGIGHELVVRAEQFGQTHPTCMAVFLHVITYNEVAIEFYKRNGFRVLKEIPGYYYFDSKHFGCYLCVKYLKGARDPGERTWFTALLSFSGLEFIFNFLSKTCDLTKILHNASSDSASKSSNTDLELSDLSEEKSNISILNYNDTQKLQEYEAERTDELKSIV